jgi:hypothetical protein
LSPQLLARLEALDRHGIRLLPVPQFPAHFVFERDGCAVLVERRGEGFGGVGSPGLIGEMGFAPLVHGAAAACFQGKDWSRPASVEEAAAARRLLEDVKSALA